MRIGAGLFGAALLTGCGFVEGTPIGGEGADEASSESESSGPGSSGAPGSDATIPPQLLECGSRSGDAERSEEKGGGDGGDEESLVLTDTDLTTVRWSTPAGFAEAVGYFEDNPVEQLDTLWVAEPTDGSVPSRNVLNVAVYVGLNWGQQAEQCDEVPLSAVQERLAGYMEQIDAELLGEAEMTEVAGLPAITQRVRLASYDYLGYWLFSQEHLVHVYCQWTDAQHQELIEQGCADLVPTVQVG
ncbi:hypothetical protein [Ruania halotolerans]|uniref:hypothetical protein n=1 Tax=Ruania halotolerans TaxID=2897773 RepID=UPI001E3ABA4B|nr:hypothetical protein [Ruania halotolerans]UFU08100.1 hypothetical protein LQF10_08395 [Ruania halotolerans]